MLERAWSWVQLRGHPGPDSSLTRLESGLLKLGDAPGALKMVAFSGRSRVPSGEARPLVTEALRVGAGEAGRAGGRGWGEGAWREAEENKLGPLGSSLPPGPTCVQVHLSLPRALRCSRSRRNVLQMFAASLPPGVPRGSAPASAKSAVGRSPFPRWVRGIFLSAFLPFTSPSF